MSGPGRAGPPLWLGAPSRYAGCTPGRARLVLVMLLLLAIAMTIQLPRPVFTPGPPAGSTETDLTLYQSIVADVRHGDDYYRATARELRARPGYPLRPFVTFRLPTLASVQAMLPELAVRALQLLLAFGVGFAWFGRLRDLLPQRPAQLVAGLLLAGGLIVSVQEALIASHELWAALLIALSLASWREDRWLAAVALGLAAMLVRETAALYGSVMAGFAFVGGRRREVAGWTAALAIFIAVIIAHAFAVWRVTGPLDPSSDGWTGLSGLWFYAQTLRHATVLEVFPFELAAPVVALALFGWTVPRSQLTLRMAAMLAAYGLLIAGLARLNNFYWGLIVGPILLAGLAFVPDGLRDLWRAALDKRRITVTRAAR